MNPQNQAPSASASPVSPFQNQGSFQPVAFDFPSWAASQVNTDQTARFLSAFEPDRFTFQTINPKGRAFILNGTLDQHFVALTHQNSQGADIYVTINQTDLRGRKNENVVRVRCIPVDTDGADLRNVERLPFDPSIVVESSPGRFWFYYLLKDGPVLDWNDAAACEKVRLDYKRTVEDLARLMESDPKISDLPHVARLPGFLHMKNAPRSVFLSRIVYFRPEIKYEIGKFKSELAKALGEYASVLKPRPDKSGTSSERSTTEQTYDRHNVGVAMVGELNEKEPPPSDILYEREKLWSLLNHVGDDGLRTFDPDGSYDDWCEKVLMAIASTGFASAPQIADAWSAQAKTASRYPGADAIYAKMATFKRERRPNTITERSLYARALARGWKEPLPSHEAQLELAERATQDAIKTALQDDGPPNNTAQDAAPNTPTTRSAYFETDLGNAKRLVARCGSNIRFVPERKCWVVFDGTRWKIDSDGAIMRLAKQMTVEMLREAAAIEDSDKRDRQVKHALKCQAAPRLAAMVMLASTEAEVVISIAKLDANPLLLGVRNGVIELSTGKFREAKREDFITMQANVSYDSKATCPNWEAFQMKITAGDRGLIAYKQEALGYCLTGLVKEEKTFIWYGTGDNGKSTERETIFSLMGDYAIAASADLLMEKQNAGNATPEVARLKGRRLVTINETREGDILNEARLKYITGHDTISARFLHENPFDFYPTHKPVLTTNHKPIVRGGDHGLWKRIHLWPYIVKIPKEEIEREFRERKLMPELSGILNWMLVGVRAYLQRGKLAAPAAVEGATAAYQQDMDVIRQWIDDRCIVGPQKTIPSGAAYFDYEQWARDEIGWAFTRVKFRRNLIDRGFAAEKGAKGQRMVQGLTLKEPTPLTVLQGGRPPPHHNRA
jgi:P4 family phage/plasmid primase-like protien